ncbi:hypothetical protein EBR37_00920 [bacterium]|jgi:hypothetical protein|nr:hypothetical protein [bacterium]
MKKISFNFPAQSIIEANLNLQSIQRALSQEYKIYSPKLETLISDKFISIYKTWDIKRKEDFVRTIAGKLNFKKVKSFFDEKTGEQI